MRRPQPPCAPAPAGRSDLGERRFVPAKHLSEPSVVGAGNGGLQLGALPPLDEDVGLAERAEDLSVERLVAEPGVDATARAVAPGEGRKAQDFTRESSAPPS